MTSVRRGMSEDSTSSVCVKTISDNTSSEYEESNNNEHNYNERKKLIASVKIRSILSIIIKIMEISKKNNA